MDQVPWLLLLYSLPAHRNTERVAVWRRFKKIGALQLTTSTYLLPDQPANYEHFQWLTKRVRDSGGEATLVRVREIEGMPQEKIIELFTKAREKDYATIAKDVRSLGQLRKARAPQEFADALERLTRQFRDTRAIDFFHSRRGEEVELLLRKTETGGRGKRVLPRVNARDYRKRTWLTRPRPEIDRVGSAWLIRTFIDAEATFAFATSLKAAPDAVSFDMLDAEFSHVGDDCTFETMTKRFAIRDKAVRKIGEMIHEADLEDGKFQRSECIGIDRVLKGWGKAGMSDDELLRNGFALFAGLYRYLQRL